MYSNIEEKIYDMYSSIEEKICDMLFYITEYLTYKCELFF